MLISVVVPIYNAAPSVQRMLDSLKAQTLVDIEVIMVDDGSTDGSSAICDKYAMTDGRFHVIHKTNGGVSVARQTGIDEARGEYVIHADSDDWVEPTMLEELYNKAKEKDADVVICDFYSDFACGSILRKQQPKSLKSQDVLRELFQQLHGSCWNKLVKRVCYKKNNVKFPYGINFCEDLLFWVQLLQHKDVTVAYLPKAFYHYCDNEQSITRKYTSKTYEMRKAFYEQLEVMLHGFIDEKRRARLSILVEAFIFGVLADEDAKRELLRSNKRAAFILTNGLRWRMGYLALAVGMYKVAHKLLRY